MNQLSRAVMQSSRLVQSARQTQRFQPNLFKLFSTEATKAPAGPTPSSSFDSLLNAPSSGPVYYGKLNNIGRHTTKTGVINMLEGSDLSPPKLKVEYNRNYAPLSMLIEFPSRAAYDSALRAINKAGRLYNLSSINKGHWDAIAPYDGKVILLTEIPLNALLDDVERFLSGCQYDSSSIQFSNLGPFRIALVRFPSQGLATHAYITKNGEFILNNKISVKLLQ